MECPYCGAELRYKDYYGVGNLAAQEKYGYGFKKLGNILKCQNSWGFNTEEEAIEYAQANNIEYNDWQDIVCESDTFNGNFYTDSNDNLHEGYPC
jgi:hypothetical protein